MILTLPRLGETMEEARVTAWLVAPGAAFRRGDVLLEVETDKTVVEVPALQDGTLIAQLVAPGETVALDQPIAEIATRAGADAARATPSPAVATPAASLALSDSVTLNPATPDTATLDPGAAPRPAASPKARAMARAAGVDLGGVPGSGRRGRITAADVAGTDGGVTVVLLHGLYDSSRSWRDLPQRLRRAGHAVFAPDLPGHGDAPAFDAGAATPLEAAVDALAALLPQGRLRLVGHSMGAVLATMLAARAAARVEKLVLLAPAGLGPRLNGDFLALMAAAETPAALARALALLDAGPVLDTALAAELARLLLNRAAVAPLARALAHEGVQQTDIAPLLAALPMPVVAVFGLADRIIDWRCCANLPARAAVHLLRGAGHLPHVAAADLIADLICDGGPVRVRGRPP